LSSAISDPSYDVIDEVSTKSGVIESPDKIWFRKLVSSVVDADRCTQCGGCIAACPSKSISIAEDNKPTLVKMCTGCSFCWYVCPRGGLRYERLWSLVGGAKAAEDIGEVKAAYTAKSIAINRKAQDGGVVTAMLEALFKNGEIDGAIIAANSGPFKGEARIATSIEEIRASAGSVYSPTLSLSELVNSSTNDLDKLSKLAFVGTPCQISGLRFLQRFNWRYRTGGAEKVKYAIALMCTRSFHPGRLIQQLKSEGVEIKLVKKMDVKENIIKLYDKDGALLFESDAKKFRSAALKGCEECADFTGRLSDVTVGSVGSAKGFSTVLIRTSQGERVWTLSKEFVEGKKLENLEAISRVEQKNLKKAIRGLRREFNPESLLWISYSDHLKNYLGSDKPPVKPSSYRIHHYETSC